MRRANFILSLSLSSFFAFSQINIINNSLTDTSQNIFYVGVDNLIKISGRQYDHLKQTVAIKGGGAELIPKGIGTYNVRVQKETNDCRMWINEKGKFIFKKDFIVRSVGDVVVRYGGVKDSTATIHQLLANPFLFIDIPESFYKHNFQITSFTATFISQELDSLKTYSVGNMLTTEQKESIKKLKTGDKIFFDGIYALSPDSRRRKLKSFTIIIE